MNFTKVFLLAILLALIVPAASATGPDRITLSSDPGWVAAGGADSAEITVQVLDEGGVPVENCTVAFKVDPVYGRISPTTVTTGASGTAATSFIPGRTSGVAVITARAGAVEETLSLSIDHGPAGRITYLDYDFEVTAGDVTIITVRLADRYGNPVDDTRGTETVRFSVGSIDDDAVFIDDPGAPVPGIERTANATGYVQVPFRTSRTVGENIVRITALTGGIDRYISIRGLPTGQPAAIAVSVNPDADPEPYQPADGESTFTLTYRLFDSWGNPAAGRDIRVATSLAGEGTVLTTNGTGIARLTYGPKDTTGRIALNATAVDNASVTVSQVVEFVHTAPVDMLLSANPQSMPSLDVPGSGSAILRAKVVDVKGNPVAGERVTFTIQNIDVGEFVQGAAPSLSASSAETDDDGYAIVRFYPGTFTTDRSDPRWSAAAKGGCNIVATWNGTTRTIPLTWGNYPYLSVEAEVSPGTVAVNDTVDVTIRLKGDGWALRPDPIDVMLVMDRSGSMGGKDVSPTRMAAAKSAAKIFVSEMNPDQDRIGLVKYGDDASCALHLTHDYSTVNTTIDTLAPSGWTSTRKALYTSIEEMVADPNSDSDAVQAVILLSDGEYNYYGDPLARGEGVDDHKWGNTRTDQYTFFTDLGGSKEVGGGLYTNQNMSVYAKNNGIRLYMVSFSNDITENSLTWKTMDTLAEATGGKHYHAATGDDLAAIYAEIAGVLKTEAGVNTTMSLDFGTIRVNGEDREGPGVFSYVYEDGVSTVIESRVENETGSHTIIPRTTVNQTDDWGDRVVQFDIGTVHLDQTWEVTFRLRVLTNGNINVFGPDSTITFNDAAKLPLPDTLVTAVPDLSNTGFGSATLTLGNPRYTCAEPVREILTAAWDLTYTGAGTLTESVEYSNDGGLSWVRFATVIGEAASLDVRALPPGEYLIRVRASADDVADAGLVFPPIRVGEQHAAYIRIM